MKAESIFEAFKAALENQGVELPERQVELIINDVSRNGVKLEFDGIDHDAEAYGASALREELDLSPGEMALFEKIEEAARGTPLADYFTIKPKTPKP